jgi:hypothetical protein
VPSSRVDRISSHRYAFHSRWVLPHAAHEVFEVLADVWRYPEWWPAFESAQRITADTGAFVLRSRLPITLRISLEREVEDARAGVLRVRSTGDLEGTVEWRLEGHPTRPETIIDFSERVTLNHRLARQLDFVIRPLLLWNHAAAMRTGEQGLRRLLAYQASSD